MALLQTRKCVHLTRNFAEIILENGDRSWKNPWILCREKSGNPVVSNTLNVKGILKIY